MSNLAKKIVSEFNDEEKTKIKNWAEQAVIIRNDQTLTAKDKIERIYKITYKDSVLITFAKSMMRFVVRHGWKERSLKGKMMIGGASLGIATMGSANVGLATAGWGASMPFFVLSGMGGAFLGTIIEEINKK